MEFTKKLNDDLKAAMKAKDQVKLRTIRAVKSAIMIAQTDGSGQEVNDDKVMKILIKLMKQRKDSLSIYKEQNREDLAQIEQEEIDVLQVYLPQQLSEDEIEVSLKSIIDKVGASSMADMGKVMGSATKEMAGKADGKIISQLVRKLLS